MGVATLSAIAMVRFELKEPGHDFFQMPGNWPLHLPSGTGRISGNTYVRDGDTIIVNRVPVRLQNLNCPELDEPGGQAAKHTMSLLVANEIVTCSFAGRHSYDRIIGRCHVNDESLADLMRQHGHCRSRWF